MPDGINKKSGQRVSDVIQSKHLEIRSVLLNEVPNHDIRPEILKTVVTNEKFETVAKSMSQSAGPCGVEFLAMSGMLLKYGGASSELR